MIFAKIFPANTYLWLCNHQFLLLIPPCTSISFSAIISFQIKTLFEFSVDKQHWKNGTYQNKERLERTWNNLQRLQRARNDLKWPTTTYNEQETIWNNLQRSEKTYNEQETTQKRLTTRMKRPETTHKEQDRTYNDPNLPTTSNKKTGNDQQRADFEIILRYGTIGSLL